MSRILLIDDDEDMLALTGRWLEKDGFEVDRATSGERALEILKNTRPDMILLDYAMPEMDGPAVLREIRSQEGLKDVPVFFRTGMEDAEGEMEGESVRPDGIIPKSQGKPYLLKAVREALGYKGIGREA
ncbi:MAG: response regulator [Lachnospiraceae bacterium]|nr:response regulator [Lachnospiraceae bacterium]